MSALVTSATTEGILISMLESLLLQLMLGTIVRMKISPNFLISIKIRHGSCEHSGTKVGLILSFRQGINMLSEVDGRMSESSRSATAGVSCLSGGNRAAMAMYSSYVRLIRFPHPPQSSVFLPSPQRSSSAQYPESGSGIVGVYSWRRISALPAPIYVGLDSHNEGLWNVETQPAGLHGTYRAPCADNQ